MNFAVHKVGLLQAAVIKLIPAASRTSAEASCMGKSVLESVFPL